MSVMVFQGVRAEEGIEMWDVIFALPMTFCTVIYCIF
jgi:hypothetical protein